MIVCPWKDIKKYAALLPGYEEYKQKVKYHLIPFIW